MVTTEQLAAFKAHVEDQKTIWSTRTDWIRVAISCPGNTHDFNRQSDKQKDMNEWFAEQGYVKEIDYAFLILHIKDVFILFVKDPKLAIMTKLVWG